MVKKTIPDQGAYSYIYSSSVPCVASNLLSVFELRVMLICPPGHAQIHWHEQVQPARLNPQAPPIYHSSSTSGIPYM